VKNDDLQALVDTNAYVIESKIISHTEYFKEVKKLKYWSIQVYCAAILHFFEMNDVVLNTKKNKRFLPADEGHYNQDRLYSTDEIVKILDICDIRSRIIILLMTSTGMRIGALPSLRLSDIKKMDEFGLYLVYVYSQSKKDRYYTFTTPECAKAIDDYFDFRKRCGEELNEKSPLLRSKVTLDNPFTAKAPKPTSVRGIQLIIEG
jgi:site-specific recombinase XerD